MQELSQSQSVSIKPYLESIYIGVVHLSTTDQEVELANEVI